ncbi:MAG: FumA C-terminus/TtdB family hydratase beta subunit [Candidatus Thermoplasmatota archaeon]|jgi:tartrate/fumarate subfamily iron-sulfur-dependent hydro-lyase beta chain|nr:FumA C-terminus/TtdB family hydratase beta subunit [Candidatus Thermoplasmatota archaeon]
MHHFHIPNDIALVEQLSAGDVFYISGTVFTARDEAHRVLLDLPIEEIPFSISEMALYHCGPLMKESRNGWLVISAGPTTSSRMEIFEERFIEKFNTRLIIGKGDMGEGTRRTLKQIKGVYAVYTGGAGALAADQIKKVVDVFWLDDLGMAEAVWIFEVEKFGPLVVGMDSKGASFFKRGR